MNLRTSLAANITPFETAMVDFFSLDMARPKGKRSLRGTYFLHYLLTQNYNHLILEYDSSDKWLSLSVFTDAYIEERTINRPVIESELLYYIIHPDINPQNLGPMLSDWVQKKEDSTSGQRPDVRDIIFNIDIHKLSHHFSALLEQRLNEKNETESIYTYIQSILDADERIAGVCAEYTANHAEALAWITVYALSDKECFDYYENQYRISLQKKTYCLTEHSGIRNIKDDLSNYDANDNQPFTDAGENHWSDSDEDIAVKNRIGKALRTEFLHNHVSTYILFALTVLQIICLAAPICAPTHDKINSFNITLFYIIMLSCSIVLLLCRFIPFYYANYTYRIKILLDNFDRDPDFKKLCSMPNIDLRAIAYRIFEDMSNNHMSQERNRSMIHIGLILFSILFFIISITVNSFPVLVSGICSGFIFYLYADSLINDIGYSVRYSQMDNRPTKRGKHTMVIGYAKLFSWDYNCENGKFERLDMDLINNHSASCIRFIFRSIADRLRNTWTVITGLTLILNIVTLITGIIQYLVPFTDYFRFPNDYYYSNFSMLLIIATGIINITVLLKTNDHYKNLCRFQYLAGIQYMSDEYIMQEYMHYYNQGTITKLDVCRGIYEYNCTFFEDGKLVTSIFPEDDRMIIVHRQYARIGRVTISMVLICLVIISITVWHFHILKGLWAIPVTALLYVPVTFWVLPKADMKIKGRIIEENNLA